MQQLVDDLLAISRVGSQGKPLVPVDAGNILAETLIRLTPLIEEAGAQIAIASDMPVVYADDVQLAQVFQNLISNAVKFRSSEPPKVQISANAVHGQCLFRVQDNGIGIDLAYAKKVFQMFQRLHGRGEYDGSGIGLAIAKRIVERHGGRIWFESKVGEGAVFFFTMKAAS